MCWHRRRKLKTTTWGSQLYVYRTHVQILEAQPCVTPYSACDSPVRSVVLGRLADDQCDSERCSIVGVFMYRRMRVPCIGLSITRWRIDHYQMGRTNPLWGAGGTGELPLCGVENEVFHRSHQPGVLDHRNSVDSSGWQPTAR